MVCLVKSWSSFVSVTPGPAFCGSIIWINSSLGRTISIVNNIVKRSCYIFKLEISEIQNLPTCKQCCYHCYHIEFHFCVSESFSSESYCATAWCGHVPLRVDQIWPSRRPYIPRREPRSSWIIFPPICRLLFSTWPIRHIVADLTMSSMMSTCSPKIDTSSGNLYLR